MLNSRIVTGLDVGNHKIRAIIAKVDPETNTPNVVGVGVAKSMGIRKGVVIDVEEAITSITTALEAAERMSGEQVNHVFVSLTGPHLESLNSKGVIAINNPGGEILEDDVDRVLEASQALSIPQNKRILKILPKAFAIDEQKGIKYPVGMVGVRLEVQAHIITGLIPNIKNMEKCVLQAGVDIDDIIPSSLTSSEAVLSRQQKELGVCVVDVGAGETSIAVYEDGAILHTAVIPIGGESVTNDLAIGLRTSIDTAEKVKIEYGNCAFQKSYDREMIDLSTLSKVDMQKVSKKHTIEIIQARYQEIFSLVKQELKNIERDGMLPAGIVLTGAGSKMAGLPELVREILKLPVQIGFPKNYEGIVDKIEDPQYASCIGLLLWGSKIEIPSYGFSLSFRSLNLKNSLQNIKSWVKTLIP